MATRLAAAMRKLRLPPADHSFEPDADDVRHGDRLRC
jgi:hypothetical protein